MFNVEKFDNVINSVIDMVAKEPGENFEKVKALAELISVRAEIEKLYYWLLLAPLIVDLISW